MVSKTISAKIRHLLAGLWAMVRGRCPRCRHGKIFHGQLAMHEVCPRCGLRFQRDQGYFLGAMYVSYPISAVLLIVEWLIACQFLPSWDITLVLFAIVVPCYLPWMPAVFRASRVGWIYFDRGLACNSEDLVDLEGWEQWCHIWEAEKNEGEEQPPR